MEIWDLYDVHEKPLNKTHQRGVALSEDEYHLVVNIWTFSQGHLLVTQRHPDKSYPYEWEVTGGSVLAGETAKQGACRELEEETGILCKESQLTLLGSEVDDHSIYKRYMLITETDKEQVRCQEGETIAYRWVNYRQWHQMMEKNEVALPIRQVYETYKQIIDSGFCDRELIV